MTAIRGARSAEGRYVQIRNAALQDERLSFRARGILGYVLSMPPQERVNSSKLAEHAPEGRDAIRAALRELEAFGYLIRAKVSGGRGRIGTETILTDDPELLHGTGNPSPENPPPEPIPGTGFQAPVPQSPIKDGEKDEGGAPLDESHNRTGAAGDAAAAPPPAATRAKVITDGFIQRYRTYKYPAVHRIVKTFLLDGRDEAAIVAALRALGDNDRPVSLDTLRIEMNGGGFRRTPRLEPSAYESSPASVDNLDRVLW